MDRRRAMGGSRLGRGGRWALAPHSDVSCTGSYCCCCCCRCSRCCCVVIGVIVVVHSSSRVVVAVAVLLLGVVFVSATAKNNEH